MTPEGSVWSSTTSHHLMIALAIHQNTKILLLTLGTLKTYSAYQLQHLRGTRLRHQVLTNPHVVVGVGLPIPSGAPRPDRGLG